MEIAEYAAETFWVTRREPVFREGPFTEEWGGPPWRWWTSGYATGCRRRAW